MKIILNGDKHEVKVNQTLDQLIQDLGLTGKRLAVELNQEIVPRSTYADVRLNSDDRIEIVQAIGGG